MLELNKVYQGDCIELMKQIDNESIDAIITDPPYGLGFKEWDNPDKRREEGRYDRPGNERAHISKGVGYVSGKELIYYQSWTTQWATEALRVLKPGGFLFSMGGTRTYHRMTCGIEDAGFTIKDCLMWTYASGFPKAQGVETLIAKREGAKRKGAGVSKDNAKQWSGWKTPALKPAYEPIVIAMKPCDGSITENVLKHSVGAFNIDECRIPYENKVDASSSSTFKSFSSNTQARDNAEFPVGAEFERDISNKGRFPANIICEDEVLDDGRITKSSKILNNERGYSDSGSFSRYFSLDAWWEEKMKELPEGVQRTFPFLISPKASRGEKNEGLAGFEEKPATSLKFNENSEFEGRRSNNVKHRNIHPTVKPIKLFSWLITLATTKDSIILDPFLGSGTTACACELMGRKWLGIEKEPEYIKIAEARIKEYQNQMKLEEVR